MNWLDSFVKTLTDYFRTKEGLTVLGVILLTAIITTILSHVIPAFGRFLWRLPKSVWGSWLMLRQRWYCKQHLPSFSIREVSPFRISKSDGSAEIKVTGTWQSREANINKTIIEGSMTLDIGSYFPKLFCRSNILTLDKKPVNITYKFVGTVCVSPLVNLDELLKQIRPIVKCRIEVEKVLLRKLGYRSLKLKVFEAKVEYC